MEVIAFVITFSKQQAATEVVIPIQQMRNGRKVVIVLLFSVLLSSEAKGQQH